MSDLDQDRGSATPVEEATPLPGGGPRPEAGPPSEPPWGLSFYLFVEPFAAGKVVVDLSAAGGPGSELLRRSGAVEVLAAEKPALPLPFPDGGADLVICALGGEEIADDARRASLLLDIRRILRREGMGIVRVVAQALEATAAGVSLRAALADMMLEHFATVDIVEETPFLAVSYFVPGCEDLAVSEAMARVGGKPSHLIALCTPAAERTWQLSESLLVPTGRGATFETSESEIAAWRGEVERLAAKSADLARERDELRELEMVLKDRLERLSKMVGAMRKDSERYLRQISDDAAGRELLSLERDQLQRRLAKAEADMLASSRELERQKASEQALRKEVARLRAARGGRGSE
jgi:regulator of replication initiation timing